jgi:sec-independent protein translocase protein TatA
MSRRRAGGRLVGVTDLGWPELLIVAVIAMMLFGTKKMPDVARSLGRSMRIVKSELRGLKEDEAAATEPVTPSPQPVIDAVPPVQPVTVPTAAAEPTPGETR